LRTQSYYVVSSVYSRGYVLRAVEVGADSRLEWSAAREVLPDECEKMVVRERCGGSQVRSEPIRGEDHVRDFGTRGRVARSSPYRGCKSEISVVGWKSWKVDSYRTLCRVLRNAC